jgi:hypothetical protein
MRPYTLGTIAPLGTLYILNTSGAGRFIFPQESERTCLILAKIANPRVVEIVFLQLALSLEQGRMRLSPLNSTVHMIILTFSLDGAAESSETETY